MRFNIYGRFTLEVVRENGHWIPYRKGDGLRRRESLPIPPELKPKELVNFLDDIYHELAHPGAQIEELE